MIKKAGKGIFSRRNIALILLIQLLISSCVSSLFDDRLVLRPVEYQDLEGWGQDKHDQALISFLKSCRKFSTLPKDRPLLDGKIGGKVGDWQNVCERGLFALHKGEDQARRFFEDNFDPYAATNWGKEEGLFTGYFEIGLEGSRQKIYPYIYPIYKKPPDMQDGKKYYTREKINQGVLENQGLELLWVSNPIQRFFLHVQGAGQVKMTDGSMVRIGYNGKNGQEYKSIGRYMIDKGWIEKENVSAQSIKQWLNEHPNHMWEVMEKNPSYVFFREIKGEGPIGAQSVPLTPMRSLAVDKTKVPYGVPTWLDVELNGEERAIHRRFQKLLVAQDTGGAIKGAVRGDIFFGAGERAEKLAGYQNNKGRYYMLLPKGVGPR